MSRKLVIVGGVAGGATAAARARRLDEKAEIVVLERGPDVSFANCGLPYHIGGEIRQRKSLLVQTEQGLESRFALDIRTRHEVLAIDRERRQVHVRDLGSGREYDEHYDDLLLSPGAAPLRPDIPGADLPNVFTLRNLADTDRIQEAVSHGAKAALVIGGGYIGLEMVENFRRRGLDVTLVELLPQVMPPLDPEIAARLHEELENGGVELRLGEAVTRLEDKAGRLHATLKNGQTVTVDLVLLAVGVRPDSHLARVAGLELNERGAIIVDEHMRTSDAHIYAVGDAVQVRDPVLGGTAVIPLAGPANRQARIAVDHIWGRPARYRGTLGTGIVRVFNVTAGLTGASEKMLRRAGVPYRKVYVHRGHHAGYFPGAQMVTIKLLFSPEGRILGGQVVGAAGVDKRLDVLAVALQAGLNVADLEDVELAYAPQYGAAKDPINIAGYVAGNALRGDEEFVYAEELGPDAAERWTILDVRDPVEYQAGHVAGAVHIPLDELRQRWRELPADRPVVAYCGVGQRAYYATRILRERGLRAANLAGGFTTYNLVHRT